MSQYQTFSIQLNMIENIPQMQQLLLVNNALLEKLQQKAAQEKMMIFINYEKLSFVINYFDTKSSNNLITILRQLQIISITLKSKAEANALNKLIKQDNLNEKLKQCLNCEMANTSIYDEITYNIGYDKKQLQREQFFISASQLFLVFQNKNNLQEKEVEKIFRNFISENFQSCTKILKVKKELLDQLKEKLLMIQQSQTDVLIKIEEKLNECQISLTKWIERENQNSQESLFQNIIEELQSQESKQGKQFEIMLGSGNQSSIINNCFIEMHFANQSQQYFTFVRKQFNSSNYFIKSNENENDFTCKIFIKGKNKKQLRQEALSVISLITITDYQIANTLLSTLSQQWTKFRESLNIMLNFFIQQPICVIQYNNSKSNQLQFSIFHSGNFQEIIKNLIGFLKSLQVVECNVSVDTILQLYNVENQEQISEQEHIIIGNNQILGQESQLKKVISKISAGQSYIKNDSNLLKTIQIDNKKKYSIIKEELQKKNLQVQFNDINQEMSLKYSNCTELVEFQQSIEKDINFKSIILPNKLVQQLEKTQTVQQLEYQHQVQIFSNTQNANNQFELTFFHNSQKKFILSQGNMYESNCKLMVNINRDFQTLLIKEKINDQCYNLINKLGNQYQTIIKTQINNQLLGQYNLSVMNDKYILTLSNLNYNEEEGYENEQCLEDLESNLNLIFQIAQDSQIQSIALPIFGCGPCDKAFDVVARKIFTKIISNLKSSQTVHQITLFESYRKRFKIFVDIIKTELDPSLKRVSIFRWGIDQKLFEKDIGDQIDQGFENYKNDNNLNKILLHYSYFKPEFTHEIDLIQNTIVNIKLQTTQILEQKLSDNCFEFFINKEPIDERLNNFLNLCVSYRYKKVKINLSEVQIVFDQNNASISTSNFPVQKYFISEFKQQEKILSDFKISSGESKKNSTLELYQCDEARKKNIQEQIDTYLSENSQIAEFNLSQLSNNKREAICVEIQKMSLAVISQDSNKIVFKFLKKSKAKIESILKQFLKFKMPKNWQTIQYNYGISNIEQNNEEFLKIKQQINLNAIQELSIQRIKNTFLWDQFIVGELQIQKRNEAENIEISKIEQTQMLWVILENHPKESYEEKSLGIKSIRGCWGQGGYFTTKLSEKNMYQERTKIHFALFCKVCIGKCEIVKDKKQHISQGYDCLYDQTQEFFFIKGKIVTRAYPMYQVQIKFY